MSDNEEIDALEKRIDLLNAELQKSNMIANKNLPVLAKTFFIFLFFMIMSFLKPELVIKIIEILINSFGAIKAVGME
jgi:hypothetical protein